MAARKPSKLGLVFGAILRKERLAQRLTQERFAELSGASAVYISNLETGRYQPTLEVLLSIEAALRLEPGELAKRTALSRGAHEGRKKS